MLADEGARGLGAEPRDAAIALIVAAGAGDGVAFSDAFAALESAGGVGGVYGQLWALCQDLAESAERRGVVLEAASAAGNVPGDHLVAAQVRRFGEQLAAGVEAADLYPAGVSVNVRGDAVALASLACGLLRCSRPGEDQLSESVVRKMLDR